MLRFLADENIESQLIAAIRRDPAIDIVRVQDVGLSGAGDPAVLEWAAQEDRVLITHDAETMADCAYTRMREGLPLAGVIQVPQPFRIGQIAEEIVLFAHASRDGEWNGRVAYLQA